MARTAATDIQTPARMLIESFSESSARASRTSFCIRSARSVMTLENAFGSDEDCSAMVLARRVVMRRLDRRGRYGTCAGTFERTEHEKPSQRTQSKHQSRLSPREVGGAFGQLLDRLILQTMSVTVHIVCKSSHKTGEHGVLMFEVVSSYSHRAGKTIR